MFIKKLLLCPILSNINLPCKWAIIFYHKTVYKTCFVYIMSCREQILFWWLSWFDIFMCLLGYDLIVFDWQALCGGERGTSRGRVVVLLKVYGEKQETSQAWQGAGQGPGPREGEEENDVNSWVREWDSTSENKKNDVNSCQRMRLSKKKNIWTCVREQGSAR